MFLSILYLVTQMYPNYEIIGPSVMDHTYAQIADRCDGLIFERIYRSIMERRACVDETSNRA